MADPCSSVLICDALSYYSLVNGHKNTCLDGERREEC